MESETLEPSWENDISDLKTKQIAPITPSPDRESESYLIKCDGSPSMHLISGKVQTQISDSKCKTPTRYIFDPFAPASDEFGFAPKKKYAAEGKITSVRRLNFDSCEEFTERVKVSMTMSDDEILAVLMSSLIEFTLLERVKDLLSDDLSNSSDSSDGFHTPSSRPLLNGIADTCPRAPIKPHIRLKKFDTSICKKLEF